MNKPHDLPSHPVVIDDADLNPSAHPSFNAVLDARLSRRALLRGGVGGAASARARQLGPGRLRRRWRGRRRHRRTLQAEHDQLDPA